jgi:hypothetical protein
VIIKSLLGKWIKTLPGIFIISNLPIIIALILLASTPVYILQNETEIANQNAGYAFYFLIVGVLWKVIQYVIKIYPRKDNIPTKR